MQNNHIGKEFYALVTRAGGKYRTIHKCTVWQIKEDGTPHKTGTAMFCVANIAQYKNLASLTGGNYMRGRPTKARVLALSDAELDAITA